AIADRCLTRSRANRYQTAAEAESDLRAFLRKYMPAYSRTALGRFVRKMFAPEIERELRMLEEYVIADEVSDDVGENLIASNEDFQPAEVPFQPKPTSTHIALGFDNHEASQHSRHLVAPRHDPAVHEANTMILDLRSRVATTEPSPASAFIEVLPTEYLEEILMKTSSPPTTCTTPPPKSSISTERAAAASTVGLRPARGAARAATRWSPTAPVAGARSWFFQGDGISATAVLPVARYSPPILGAGMTRLVGILAAAMLPGVLACGSVSKNDQAADAAVDAPPPPPVRLTALTATGDGAPDPTAIAIFVDASGTLVKDGLVNDMGRAEAMMPSGGTVHVLTISNPSVTTRAVIIQTFRGVKPGDDLTAGLVRTAAFPSGSTTQMTGSFTSTGTGFTYSFSTDCGGSFSGDPGAAGTIAAVPAITFRDGCHDATIRMLAIANPSTAGLNPRFVFTSFTHNAGGVFSVPNTWQTMPNFTLTLNDLPEEITGFNATRYSYLGDGGTLQAGRSAASAGDPPAGTNTLSIPFPVAVGPRALVQVTLSRLNAVASQELTTRTANVAASLAVDATALPLPWITEALTINNNTVSWKQEGAGTPDLRLVRWAGRFTTTDNIATSVSWYLADAGDGEPSVTLPSLPASYAAYDPTQQTATPTLAQLFLVDRSDVSGYDAARPHMFEYLVGISSGLDGDKPYTMRRVVTTGRGLPPRL
ncbi:MAG: hypothetical protein HC863_02930, partial [Myxococcales bacterium]|nr:hypothetical protein [Myxococcales bacterium]